MKKKDWLILITAALVPLIVGLALAYATYQAPAHAEEREYQLEMERLARQEQIRQQPQRPTQAPTKTLATELSKKSVSHRN